MALLRDTPEFPFDVTSCLARAERHSWYPSDACDLPGARVLDPRIYAAEQSAAASLPGVRLIDLDCALCPRGVCKAVVNGTVMYRDTHHLAGKSAASLEPSVGLTGHGRAALTLTPSTPSIASIEKTDFTQLGSRNHIPWHPPPKPGVERGRRTCTKMPFQSYDWGRHGQRGLVAEAPAARPAAPAFREVQPHGGGL